MPETYYQKKLYPLQDKILKIIMSLNLDFYLTGRTALGRCYLQHRYSDDLDFFVNDNPSFKKQSATAIDALKKFSECDVAATAESFARVFIKLDGITLKVDFVNDVAAHFGNIEETPIFNRVDSWRNILSNKICALSRLEAKDFTDIIFIARKYPFEWELIINEAKEKDLWVDPIEICRLISQFPVHLLNKVKWIQKVDLELLEIQLNKIHDDIFTGSTNSLFKQD